MIRLALPPVLAVLLAAPVLAQEVAELEAVRDRLADPERFTVSVDDTGLTDEMVRGIADVISNAIDQEHYYGAAAAYLPDDSNALSFRIYGNHHTLEAAEAKALADCNDERDENDSPCRIIARILPEQAAGGGPEPAEGYPPFSVELTAALVVAAERLDGEFADRAVAIATSESGASWGLAIGDEDDTEIRGGALETCNEEEVEAGGTADCRIVAERTAPAN